MAMEQPSSDSLRIQATATKADASLTGRGDKVYKLAFEYPPQYIADIDAIVGEQVDVYWNDDLVALGATVTGTTVKAQRDDEPRHILTIEAPAGDTSRKNMADQVQTGGDLRLRVMQMALNSGT